MNNRWRLHPDQGLKTDSELLLEQTSSHGVLCQAMPLTLMEFWCALSGHQYSAGNEVRAMQRIAISAWLPRKEPLGVKPRGSLYLHWF